MVELFLLISVIVMWLKQGKLHDRVQELEVDHAVHQQTTTELVSALKNQGLIQVVEDKHAS